MSERDEENIYWSAPIKDALNLSEVRTGNNSEVFKCLVHSILIVIISRLSSKAIWQFWVFKRYLTILRLQKICKARINSEKYLSSMGIWSPAFDHIHHMVFDHIHGIWSYSWYLSTLMSRRTLAICSCWDHRYLTVVFRIFCKLSLTFIDILNRGKVKESFKHWYYLNVSTLFANPRWSIDLQNPRFHSESRKGDFAILRLKVSRKLVVLISSRFAYGTCGVYCETSIAFGSPAECIARHRSICLTLWGSSR